MDSLISSRKCYTRVPGALVATRYPEDAVRFIVADSLEAPGTSKRFQILYRNEEVTLGTSVLFRAHVLVHSHKIEEVLSRTHFNLGVELWFSEPTQPGNMACVSSR